MPLTLEELEEIQADAMADDIEIDFDKMSLWSREKATAYFEGGGVEEEIQVSFTPLPKLTPQKFINKGEWMKNQSKNAKGDTYNIEFPHTFSQLSSYGPSWFTKAFHLTGVLSKDNAVEELVEVKRCQGGGAAEKAFVTVRYKTDEPGLHTRLFAKFPHEADPNHKHFISCVIKHDQPEVRWAQRLAHKGPISAPKTYFAEYSSISTNYVLITERIEFADEERHPIGKAGKDVLKPMEIERVYDKFMDHLIGSDPLEYYTTLANALGKLVGWYKSNHDVGTELNSYFPFSPPPTPAPAVNPMASQLVEMVTKTCRVMFDDDVAAPAYQAQLQREIKELAPHLPTIHNYLFSGDDYISYAHPNANIDNAFWWRDEEGKLHCGLIDFGGYGCSNVATHLSSALMSAEPRLHVEHTETMLKAFIDGSLSMGGPKYDLEELKLRLILVQAMQVVAGAPGALLQVFQVYKKEEWLTIKEKTDPRITGRDMRAFLGRAFATGPIATPMAIWKRMGSFEKVKAFVTTDKAKKAVMVVKQ